MTERIHGWFSLSYANYMVLPRVLLQSMPDEWQEKFVDLLEEYDDHWCSLPEDFQPGSYRVNAVRDGQLVSLKSYRLPHYNRGRCHVERDGTITGERFPR